MKLVWEENFDYVGLPNPNKWTAQVGGHGWGNNEPQYYTESGNAWVDGEKLTITARREDFEGKEITSARIRTCGKGNWQYGRIEVRAKLPKGLGVWPAIWMMPTPPEGERINWPDCGEIDIMEHVNYLTDTVISTVHTGAYNHRKNTHRGGQIVLPGVSDKFHVYSVDWDANKMDFQVDGKTIFHYAPKLEEENVTDAEWPFDKPFHLILNLAFGGNWGGAKGVDMNALPATFEIDYVRVYQ